MSPDSRNDYDDLAERVRVYAERYNFTRDNPPISFSQFIAAYQEIRGILYNKDVLFRGHASSTWSTRTTLERSHLKEASFDSYMRFVQSAKPYIESHTGKDWNLSEKLFEPLNADYDKANRDFRFGRIPALEFQVYLRHHGLPSPLLDWTRSPYVAAYFAFADKIDLTDDPAIIMYSEYAAGAKVGPGSEGNIYSVGHYLRGGPRHFAQQAEYTIAARYSPLDRTMRFVPHEEIFSEAPGYQDTAFKFVISRDEQRVVLRELEMTNINSYTLFGTEDSLMQAITFRDRIRR